MFANQYCNGSSVPNGMGLIIISRAIPVYSRSFIASSTEWSLLYRVLTLLCTLVLCSSYTLWLERERTAQLSSVMSMPVHAPAKIPKVQSYCDDNQCQTAC